MNAQILCEYLYLNDKNNSFNGNVKKQQKCNLVIAKQKSNRKKNHYFTALHGIRNVQTLIEIEGQTCFSAFAGLRVLYLNLPLVS